MFRVSAARYRGVPRVLVEGVEVIGKRGGVYMLFICLAGLLWLFIGAWATETTLHPFVGALASFASFLIGVNVGLASHE